MQSMQKKVLYRCGADRQDSPDSSESAAWFSEPPAQAKFKKFESEPQRRRICQLRVEPFHSAKRVSNHGEQNLDDRLSAF
ncbi:hypothetical protein PSCICF_31170 [Pseudomonas cichorii]|nr:hypothetical protein PSCICF_31170 [Pseudomonas cichorii]